MPFPSALTTQQKTDIRTTGYSRKLHILATPKSIVFQATVKDAVTDSDYASILFDPPTTGAYTDIVSGMTVLVHRSSSDIDDLVFPATYARGAATTTAVNIGWQASDLDGTETITVLDDYRIYARQIRYDEASDTVFLDYDDAWSALPPAIHGLQSVYAVNQSTTATLSFAPTVEAMASGATISTYLWDVGDGTITVGTSASQNITATFPAWSSGATDGWRWVSLTATDSNGNSSVFRFQVFVGDFESVAWVYQDVDNFSISNNLADGYVASMTIGSNAANVYGNQHIAAVVTETKNGDSDPLVSNIAFAGRAKSLVDDVIAELLPEYNAVSLDKNSTYELQGYGVELALLPLPEYQLVWKSAASDWNEVTDLSIARAIWYALWHLTSAPVVMAFDLNISTWNGYEAVGYSFEAGTALDGVTVLGDKVGARLVFARSGEAEFIKDARLEGSTARDALVTVVDLITDDMRGISTSQPAQARIGRVEVTGASYNTSLGASVPHLATTLLRAISPKIPNTLGESIRQFELVLASDPASQDDTESELAEMTGNYLARNNEVERITLNEMLDSYWWIVSHHAQWYTVTASGFQSGTSYDTNTRWLVESNSLSVSTFVDDYGTPHQEWVVSAELTIETTDAGIANSIVYAPEVMPYDVPQVSFMGPYGSNYDPDNSYGSGGSTITQDTGSGDGMQPVNPTESPSPFKDTITVPLDGTTVSTNKTTVNGNVYKVTVSGSGVTDSTNVTVNPNAAAGGGISTGITTEIGKTYTLVTTGTWNYGLVATTTADGSSRIADELFPLPGAPKWSLIGKVGSGSLFFVGSSLTFTADSVGLLRLQMNDDEFVDNSGTLTTVITSDSTFTDAFFDYDDSGATAHGASKGIQVQGTNQALSLTSPPYYTNSHTYSFYMTGAGTQEDFNYLDTDYTDNVGSLTVTVEGVFA